ncbi:TIR domain-containing protein [Phthorimaea operculella]|nr:TIR domain-containing protein [Phthorimaea operculella]
MRLINLTVFVYNLCVAVAWRHFFKRLDQTLAADCNGKLYLMGKQDVDIDCDSNVSHDTAIKEYITKINVKGCWGPSRAVDTFDADFTKNNCEIYEYDKEKTFVPHHERDFHLNLQNVEWPGWTTMEHVVEINMKNVTINGTWHDCSDLLAIRIFETINLRLAPEDWLSNCKNLEYIFINGIPLDQMITVVKSAPKSVNMIDLYDLSYPRKLSVCSFEAPISKEKRATCAGLSVSLISELAKLPKLETLYIEGIDIDFCTRGSDHPVSFPSLKYIALHNTRTDRVCFKNTRAVPLLTEIVIDGPIGITLQFSELITHRSMPQLLADFKQVAVAAFQFTRDDYLVLEEGSRVILQGLARPLACSCTENLWLVQAMKAGWVEIPGAFCTDGSPPMDMICDRLPCQRISCNSSCVCCRDGSDIIGDCRDANISTLPEQLLDMDNLTDILAPNNNISTVPEKLPDTLEFLDLRGNNIWKAGAAHVAALFANPQRRVRLAGNTIFCTCEYQTLIATLQTHRIQVEDFEDLKCDFSEEKISEVVVAELCAAQERDAAVKMAVSIALGLAVLSLVVALAWHHWQEIKIYLYARGYCLCCIREDEIDSDRPYDIFLTFSHEDSELVVNELLPVLDKEYSVCVHQRDWCPGEMITTQIALSVERSRRTVVVLSRNFVRSLWGRLEFQTAHVSGLTEGRVRVIMIVLDDVLESDELSAEMRAYVRLNTYVKFDDPWLWDKLKYALPHRPRGPLRSTVPGQMRGELKFLRHHRRWFLMIIIYVILNENVSFRKLKIR